MPNISIDINATTLQKGHDNLEVVGSISIAEFCSEITVWPKSKDEMNKLAEILCKLFKAKMVAILGAHSIDGVNLELDGSIEGIDFNREGFLKFLKDQLQSFFVRGDVSKKIIAPILDKDYRMLLGTVQNVTHSRLEELYIRSKGGLFYLVVGLNRRWDEEGELTLEMTVHHLYDLARIAELETAVEIRNQFLSIASHELKTPLTSIYGILQLQERMLRGKWPHGQFPDPERQHGFIKMVIRQVERLNELIDGLLDVSRIQNGRFIVEPSETDVALLLQECVESRLKLIAQEAGVRLNVESVPKLIAEVDPVRMEEVITNLVMNAIRFSPEGGVVWIRLRDEDGSFRLTVRDQGPSISMEDRDRIFQPFERAQRTSRLGGLGLGLFISRQIALLHGGNVNLVESVPGKGNVFEAFFPNRVRSISA